MKKFHFNLQKLLNLRTFKEREAEVQLGKTIALKDAIALRLKEIAHKEIATRHTFNASKKLVIDLLAYENYLERLHEKKEQELKALTEAELCIEEARKRYIAAHRERLIISKLCEKKEQYWKKEMLKYQEDMLSDIINAAQLYYNTAD